MAGARSSSQLIFAREAASVSKMPTTSGAAACAGDTRFDVLFDREHVSQDTRNELARVCADCPLLDCGWRQTRKPGRYARKTAPKDN